MLPIYDSHYSLSEKWEVVNTVTGLTLQQRILNGYKAITLTINKQRKTFYIHRLLCLLYLPKIEGKNHINHKDKNRLNNNLNNLEWVTQSENNKHSWIWRTQTTNQRLACIFNWRKNWKDVYQFSKEWQLINMFSSTREAESCLWIAHTSIWYCCNWKRKTAGKFVWSYVINPQY